MESVKVSLLRQLKNNFGLSPEEESILKNSDIISRAERTSVLSLSKWNPKYFSGNINPLITTQYCQFLYWCSRYAFENIKNGSEKLGGAANYLIKSTI